MDWVLVNECVWNVTMRFLVFSHMWCLGQEWDSSADARQKNTTGSGPFWSEGPPFPAPQWQCQVYHLVRPCDPYKITRGRGESRLRAPGNHRAFNRPSEGRPLAGRLWDHLAANITGALDLHEAGKISQTGEASKGMCILTKERACEVEASWF